MPKAERYLPLCITVVNPPSGVVFALQRGKGELLTPVMATGDDLSFNFEVRVGNREDEMANFLGPFVQGPRGGRFVYINSGTLAGQVDSCWTRRAKVSLKIIGWDLGSGVEWNGAAPAPSFWMHQLGGVTYAVRRAFPCSGC